MTLGERIRQARERVGLTQERFATQLVVTKGAVSQWELNKTAPRYKALQQIAEITGTSVSWLWGPDYEGLYENPNGEVSGSTNRMITVYGQEEPVPENLSGATGMGLFPFVCPGQLASVNGVYGVQVGNAVMSPRYEKGEIVIIDPRRPVIPGDYVAASIRNKAGQAHIVIGRLVEHSDTELVIHQFNPGMTLHCSSADVVSVGFIAVSSVIS